MIFRHDPLEELGLFSEVLERGGLSFRTVRLFESEMPTEDWDAIGALVILGGTMGIYDEQRYPFLKFEKAIIRTAMRKEIPLLGIGLGAQLIAAAAGAEVYRGNFKEIGWYPISMTIEGEMDPLLTCLPGKPMVFHWHGDSFDLPRGALRLASSFYYVNQAFRLGRNIYGLQFHLDVTLDMIERWMKHYWKELAQVPYISPDKIRADSRSYGHKLRHYGEMVFSDFLRRVCASKGKTEERHQVKR